MKKNVAIDADNITKVKVAIAFSTGKDYSIGTFYAEAASEKIKRDGLPSLDMVTNLSPKKEGE